MMKTIMINSGIEDILIKRAILLEQLLGLSISVVFLDVLQVAALVWLTPFSECERLIYKISKINKTSIKPRTKLKRSKRKSNSK